MTVGFCGSTLAFISYRSQDVLDRIAKATKVIAGGEALGGPSGRKSDALKMISDELVYLGHIMKEWL